MLAAVSGNSGRDKPRVRAPAFTDKEDEALLKAYSKHRHIIRGRNSMGVTQRTRTDAWEAVAQAVNQADGRCERTVKSVKIHYGNMLAEYKAYKSNDRTSRNSQSNPQPFYRYFDELFDGKSVDGGGFDVSAEDYSVDGSDEFAGPNGQNNLLAALCGGDPTRYANGTALNALMNSVQAAVENGVNGDDSFLQMAYLSSLPGGSINYPKTDLDASHHSDSERTSSATSCAANTPPAAGLNNNSYGNLAAQLNGVGGTAANGKPPLVAKKRRGSNVSAETPELSEPTASADADARQTILYKRHISALRVKILEKELAVLEWKEETLRKKSRLLDLKIANELRAASGGEAAGASDSMDTTAAFVKPPAADSDVAIKCCADEFASAGQDIVGETTDMSPPRKVARLHGEGQEARAPETLDVDEKADQIAVEAALLSAHSNDSEYSLLNDSQLVISTSHTSIL